MVDQSMSFTRCSSLNQIVHDVWSQYFCVTSMPDEASYQMGSNLISEWIILETSSLHL